MHFKTLVIVVALAWMVH